MKYLFLMMILALPAAGCSHLPEPDRRPDAPGSLILRVFPGAYFDPREFDDTLITGSGPRDFFFTRYAAFDGTPLHIDRLPPGTWDITAESRNSRGAVTAFARREVTVHPDAAAEAVLLLMPDTSPGELELIIRGPVRPGLEAAAAVQHIPGQRITELIPDVPGRLRARLFAGHYLLRAALLDEAGNPQWSGVTPVRVLGNEGSAVTLTFDETGAGRFASEASHQPLSVEITGLMPEIPSGQTMRLSLHITPGLHDSAEYLFLWNFSGKEAVTTGEPVFTYRAPSRTGLRQLTVLVLMTDPRGRILQAGSASEIFTVTR